MCNLTPKTGGFMRLVAIVFLILCGLAGCAGAPSEDQLRSADYGSAISQADAERLAVAFLEARLKDPQSAQYKWSPVERGWARDPVITGGTLYYGYLLVGQVNAKNSYGGYVGYRKYQFMFQNGKLRQAWAEEVGSYGSIMAPM
jgi:hypothetical protein